MADAGPQKRTAPEAAGAPVVETRHRLLAGEGMNPRGRKPRVTVAKVARGLVVQLIEWEMGAADGQAMAVACQRFGSASVRAALESIIRDLERQGVAHLSEADMIGLGF